MGNWTSLITISGFVLDEKFKTLQNLPYFWNTKTHVHSFWLHIPKVHMANFEAFRRNFSSGTYPEIVRSDFSLSILQSIWHQILFIEGANLDFKEFVLMICAQWETKQFYSTDLIVAKWLPLKIETGSMNTKQIQCGNLNIAFLKSI